MPSRSLPLWLLTGALLAAFPLLNFVYWPLVLRSGTLSPDADSIGIPMFSSIILAMIVSPIVLAIAWLCLRRYNPEARFTAFRRDRPYRSVLATLIFGGAASWLAMDSIAQAGAGLPWYEYLWPTYSLLWLPWLLGLRSAIIEQHSSLAERAA